MRFTFISTDESAAVEVPEWVEDIDSFRRWAHSDDFPERGKIWWLGGGVWADMSMEQIFTHLAVKNAITTALTVIAALQDMGTVIPDGLLVSNFEAEVVGEPDMTFVSFVSFESGRVRLIEGAKGGYVELQGSPDVVLEVVSAGSISKDKKTMKKSYFKAGVMEYWIADARKDDAIAFDIFRRGPRAFAATPTADGWVRSSVFGRSFRLVRRVNRIGQPSYVLETK